MFDSREIERAVDELTTACDLDEARVVFCRRPELLTEEAEHFLRQCVTAQRGDGARRLLEEFLTVLRRCRALGVDEAFQNLQFGRDTTSHTDTVTFDDISAQIEGLVARYQQSGDLDLLDHAARMFEQTSSCAEFKSESALCQADTWCAGGAVFLCRYQARAETTSDLCRAISCFEEAVNTGKSLTELSRYLNNLGSALNERFNREGNKEDLASAIDAWRSAVSAIPRDDPFWWKYHANLGAGLSARYRLQGDLNDLYEAIERLHQAVEEAATESPELPHFFNNLGLAQGELYEATAQPDLLEKAIESLREAVDRTSSSSPDLPMYCNNLGTEYRDKYDCRGNIDDLERAVQCFRRAVQITPSGSHLLAGFLANLGSSRVARFTRLGTDADLDEGIQALSQSVQVTPERSPALPGRLNSLGNALRDHYRQFRQVAYLERAIDVYEQALAIAPKNASYIGGCWHNLSNGLSDRFDTFRNSDDLDRAFDCARTSVNVSKDGDSQFAARLGSLANLLRDRYRVGKSDKDLKEAVTMYRRSTQLSLVTSLPAALGTASNWGKWAFERRNWKEAIEAFSFAQEASDKLLKTQVARTSKESWLRESQGVGAISAYCHAMEDDLEAAVVVLERSCARLMADALQRTTADLNALRATDVQLSLEYQEAASRVVNLEKLAATRFDTDEFDFGEKTTAAARDLETIVDRIRGIPGYEQFLRPPAFSDIRAVAELRPSCAICYVCTTSVGSLALLVTSTEVRIAWPDFEAAELDRLLQTYVTQMVEGDALFEHTLYEALNILGTRLVSGIASLLRRAGVENVVLVPVGRLAMLPIHAASYITKRGATCLIDEFCVTFTPNAGAMTAGSARPKAPSKALRCLAVGNPLPSDNPLLAAEAEVAEIARLFDRTRCSILCGPGATKDSVAASMPGTSVAHFACHGILEPERPLDSCLVLSGTDRLTLRDILYGGEDFSQVRLIVLSACRSAVTEFRNLPDEIVALPSGFLQAGVASVVGTLWPVDDWPTAVLMTRFYECWLTDERTYRDSFSPAEALRSAQCWLRDVTEQELERYMEQHPRLADIRSELKRSRDITRVKSTSITTERNETRPFRDQPFCWAPFVCFGN